MALTAADLGRAAALALAFLVLALWRLDVPAAALFDEVFHAKAAMELAAGRPPSEITHPPLVKAAIAASIRLTAAPDDVDRFKPASGARPDLPPALTRAWRLPSALAGAGAVFLLYLLARALALSPVAAAAAAGLLALDGCFFVHARVAQTNVFEVLFVLAAALGAWLAVATGRDRWLVLAGLAVGGSLACRWSGAAPALLLAAWLAWRWRAEPGRLVRLAAAWVVLPPLVYVAAYVPLVLQGGSVLDPARWQVAFVDAQFLMFDYHARAAGAHAYASAWWSWPLMARPVWYGFWVAGPMVTGVWAIGNAAVWWASAPALGMAAYAGWKGRAELGFVALLGLGAWLAWAVQPRALTFMHYYLTAIPFACIALAAVGRAWWHGAGLAGGDAPFERDAARVVVGGFALAVVAWSAFYYPVLAGWPLDEAALRARVWFGGAWL